jgi:hypothetical protein
MEKMNKDLKYLTFNFCLPGHSRKPEERHKLDANTLQQIHLAQILQCPLVFDTNFSPGTCGGILVVEEVSQLSQTRELTS